MAVMDFSLKMEWVSLLLGYDDDLYIYIYFLGKGGRARWGWGDPVSEEG